MTPEQQRQRDLEYLAAPDPERIWLGPKCEGLSQEGRTWSTEPHHCEESECGLMAIEYIRLDAAIADRYRAKIARLQAERDALLGALTKLLPPNLAWKETGNGIVQIAVMKGDLRAARAAILNEQSAPRPCPVCDGIGEHKWNCTLNR